MDTATVTALCSLVSTLVLGVLTGYWKYNQNTKDKMTDLKIEVFKRESDLKNFKWRESTAKVYGELWKILYTTNASRVYIVQPHPLGNAAFLSVQFEVIQMGVSSVKESLRKLPMEEVPLFSKQMAEKMFMCFTDIDSQVEDKMARSLFAVNGTRVAAIKRLNSSYDWVGNIFCEFTDEMEIPEDKLRKILHDSAVKIQYILPEYRENPLK